MILSLIIITILLLFHDFFITIETKKRVIDRDKAKPEAKLDPFGAAKNKIIPGMQPQMLVPLPHIAPPTQATDHESARKAASEAMKQVCTFSKLLYCDLNSVHTECDQKFFLKFVSVPLSLVIFIET